MSEIVMDCDSLILDAEVEAARRDCSPSELIESWARLGQAVSPFLSSAKIDELVQSSLGPSELPETD